MRGARRSISCFLLLLAAFWWIGCPGDMLQSQSSKRKDGSVYQDSESTDYQQDLTVFIDQNPGNVDQNQQKIDSIILKQDFSLDSKKKIDIITSSDGTPSLKADKTPIKKDLKAPQKDTAPPNCPQGCDDNNPCTEDYCQQGNCQHRKQGQIIIRLFNPTTLAHAFVLDGQTINGFQSEGGHFRTLKNTTAGTSLLYQQSTGKDYMLSLDNAEGVVCCGYKNSGSLGYVFPKNTGGTIPLYRHYNTSLGLHLSSALNNEGSQYGYHLENVTAYVCPL